MTDPTLPVVVDEQRRELWRCWGDAVTFARVRNRVHKARQRVRAVDYHGQTRWHVSVAKGARRG